MRKEIDLGVATRLINHGPVVMVSSRCDGNADITPVAWTMPVQKNPPLIVLEISEKHFIFECIMKTGDFAVNIPSKSLVGEIVKCGSVSGRDTDKFGLCGFSAEPSKKIKSPSLKEAMAVIECELIRDEHLLKEYNMVLGEVKYAEADEKAFDEHWLFEREDLMTVHHLGDRTFTFPGGGVIDLRKDKI
jgi:flavin reductase (DIM6/NTAB) family NADH-FMN oxidoreductase RutF